MTDGNLEEIVSNSQSPEVTVSSHPPKWFNYASMSVLPVLQVANMCGAAYGIGEFLKKEPEVAGYLFPLLMFGTVAGLFLVREGYSRVVNSLSNHFYSQRSTSC